jgi:hypothetical protein
LQEQGEFTSESFRSRLTDARLGRGIPGGAMTVGYALWAIELAGREPDETTDALLAYLLKTQAPDGHWSTGGRPPLEESPVTATVLSARALDRFARPSQRPEVSAAVHKARDWVAGAGCKVQEDRTSKLWGLVRLGGGAEEIDRARHAVIASQHEDGGWSSRDDLPSDAYATGQTLARLRESGFPASHPAFRRGIAYLLATRQPDGSWKVATRSRPVQVYFDNGDPNGKDQFISTPATCWAVVALCGEPVSENPARP